MSEFDYDLIVIGGGAAGMVSSSLAAGLGKKVALVEHRTLGGECTRSGCVPSKALIKAANVFHYARSDTVTDFGLRAEQGAMSPENVMAHVRGVVGRVYHGHRPEVFSQRGMELIFGKPVFVDHHHVEVDGKTISAASFVIATGTTAFIPPIEGIGNVPILTNESFFELEQLPSSMIVLGGGPIGTEIAQAAARLGVAVTIVEMGEQILIREEKELRDLLADRLREEGITLLTKTKALSLAQDDGQVRLTVEGPEKDVRTIGADAILVAVGRKPNIEGLELNRAGVDYSTVAITTDTTLKTTASNIYACGDVVGPYQFSHMAEYQARIATQNALLPVKKHADYEHYIWCMFTDPELAHAGLTEDQAREAHGSRVKVYKWEYRNTDRGKTEVEELGLCKIICDDRYRVLGAHILGSRAGDLIHELQIIKTLGQPLYKLDSVIHIYPTFSDVIRQPAKQSHIDELKGNLFVQLLSSLFGSKKQE